MTNQFSNTILTPDPIYNSENVALFEIIYGKNLISLGGHSAIANMFSDLNLKGLKLLDIGFGLGGMAFYLAKQYQIEISGIELHPWMAEYAKAHAPKEIANLLNFVTYNEAGKMPFKAASFDLAYSKGVLNHVHDKISLFKQVNAALKPNGLFVIADWIYPDLIIDNDHPLVNETQQSYQKVLENTGFTNISFRDDSNIFLGYVDDLINNMVLHKERIEKEYGAETFSIIWDDHQKLMYDIRQQCKFATRILAKKNG